MSSKTTPHTHAAQGREQMRTDNRGLVSPQTRLWSSGAANRRRRSNERYQVQLKKLVPSATTAMAVAATPNAIANRLPCRVA